MLENPRNIKNQTGFAFVNDENLDLEQSGISGRLNNQTLNMQCMINRIKARLHKNF